MVAGAAVNATTSVALGAIWESPPGTPTSHISGVSVRASVPSGWGQ